MPGIFLNCLLTSITTAPPARPTACIIQKNEIIPRENIKAGDRIKAYCHDVRREPRGQQIFLSRAHPKFMEKLFVQEVPEIYDGLIEIKSSSRDPGNMAPLRYILRTGKIISL